MMARHLGFHGGHAALRLTVLPAAEAFGEGFEGDAFRLECPPEAVLVAKAMGWQGDASPLHTMMPDTADKTMAHHDVSVSDEDRETIIGACGAQAADERKARGMRLTSDAERDGRGYIFRCAFEDKDIPKAAGFRWNGGVWWTDRPAAALKLVEHADSFRLAAELRAACKALPPILKPTCEVASNLVCDIRLVKGQIRADFPAKHDGFLETIRAARFHWDGDRWIRTVTARMGSVPDRMADIAHTLLEEGFLVRVHDAEAQAKAISGDFEAEETRWVSVAAGTERWDGWYALTWRKSDDLYDVTKSLPGARWIGKMLVVPPASYEAVADFAGRYDFQMTPGAEGIGDAQREAIIGAITVAPAKRKAKPAAAKRRPKVKAVEATVDESLLDGDDHVGLAPAPEPAKPVAPPSAWADSAVGKPMFVEGEQRPRTTLVGLNGKPNPAGWRFETAEDRADREAADIAAVRSVFGPLDVPPKNMEGIAMIARAWGTTKFVEVASCLRPGTEGPPITRVQYPGGGVAGFDVTKFLDFSVATEDGRTTVTWLAPAYPRASSLSTWVRGYDPELGERIGSVKLGISNRPRIEWHDWSKRVEAPGKEAA